MTLLLAALLLAGPAAAPEPIALRTPIDWTPASGPRTVSAGGVTVALSTRPCAKDEVFDECVIPVARVAARGLRAVTLVGQQTGSHYAVSVAIGPLVRGQRVPSVLFQTYGGGAHCCTAIRVAQPVGAAFRSLDLGVWDGEAVPFPRDVSGDGIADFVFRDNAFLYAFTAYAFSYAPPLIVNVRAGHVVEVSREPAFRTLYARDMVRARKACERGEFRNGACPAYVADAARLGRFAAAWPVLLAHYDRTADGWADACRSREGCAGKPRDYPAAVRAFLRDTHYLP